MIPLRWRMLGTEAEEAARQVNTYRLSGGPDFVRWDCPDGFTCTLDLRWIE